MTVSFILYMNVAPVSNLFIREAGNMLDLILAKLFMLLTKLFMLTCSSYSNSKYIASFSKIKTVCYFIWQEKKRWPVVRSG